MYILRYDTASVAVAIVKMSICRVTFTVGNYYGMSPEHNFKILLISWRGPIRPNGNLKLGKLSEWISTISPVKLDILILCAVVFEENYGPALSKEKI